MENTEVRTYESYYLCLAQTNNLILPVYLPQSASIAEGDLVLFHWNGRTTQAIIQFMELCDMYSDLWRAIVIAKNMLPIMVSKYAQPKQTEWINVDWNADMDDSVDKDTAN